MAKTNAERQAAHREKREAERAQVADDLEGALMLGAVVGFRMAQKGQRYPDWLELHIETLAELAGRAVENDDRSPRQVARDARLLQLCESKSAEWRAFYGTRLERAPQ